MTFWDKLGSADSKLTKKSTSFMKARNKLFENPMFFRERDICTAKCANTM